MTSRLASLFFLLIFLTVTAFAESGPTAKIVVIGDSLSAAYGMPMDKGWVRLLQDRIRGADLPYQVINASISGETSRAALNRLPALIEQYHPSLIIIETGGNDGLRGLPLDDLKNNLSAMLRLAADSGATTLLIGMRMPPNYGPEYTTRFHEIYNEVAKERRVPYVPFLLEGVAGNPTLMQADGMHATAEAQPQLLENVWPHILAALGKTGLDKPRSSTKPAKGIQ